MHLTQDVFDQIVSALVDQLDAKHAHVKTISGSDPAQPFHLGYSVAADALHAALHAHGVKVVDTDDDATSLLREAMDSCSWKPNGGPALAIRIRDYLAANQTA